jgi:hypothetical protein
MLFFKLDEKRIKNCNILVLKFFYFRYTKQEGEKPNGTKKSV